VFVDAALMPGTRRIALIAAFGALATAGPAAAATDATSVTIAAGGLEYTTALTAGNFPNVTLDGTQKTVSANVSPYVITDSRGGSAGWNLTIEASRFTSASADMLPQGALAMALPPLPTKNAVTNPLGVTPTVALTLDPIDNGTAQKVLSAAALPLSGAGAWTITPLPSALTLTVPAVVPPGTYTSTITTTLSTGP
jgi:hypothetical protein